MKPFTAEQPPVSPLSRFRTNYFNLLSLSLPLIIPLSHSTPQAVFFIPHSTPSLAQGSRPAQTQLASPAPSPNQPSTVLAPSSQDTTTAACTYRSRGRYHPRLARRARVPNYRVGRPQFFRPPSQLTREGTTEGSLEVSRWRSFGRKEWTRHRSRFGARKTRRQESQLAGEKKGRTRPIVQSQSRPCSCLQPASQPAYYLPTDTIASARV